MNTTKDNVQKMIDAFIAFDKDASKDPQKADDLLRFLLDHSKLPEFQWEETDDGKQVKRTDNLTDSEQEEIEQMESLLNATHADNVIWETPEDLRKLIVTYPPVILEQLLICAIAIRILRHDEIWMDSDTDAFEEFYQGWCSVVIAC